MVNVSPVEQLRSAVREQGLRATPSRLAVLGLLRTSNLALSHAQVAEQLENQGWDRATIFRNLTDLAEVGLLRRSDRGDHVWRFESEQNAHSATSHPHFLCTHCGDMSCLPEMEMIGRKAPRSVKAKSVEIQVRGLCDSCALAADR